MLHTAEVVEARPVLCSPVEYDPTNAENRGLLRSRLYDKMVRNEPYAGIQLRAVVEEFYGNTKESGEAAALARLGL